MRTELKHLNGRGQTLQAFAFIPPNPKAILVFHHGYAEHSRRKFDVFDQLYAAGIAVYTYDMHGHGQSEPKEEGGRALVWHWHHLVDDLCSFAAAVRERHLDKGYPPTDGWFLGGYSAGAIAAAHAALRQPGQWRGMVLVAAALGLKKRNIITRLQAAIATLLHAVAPTRKLVKGMETSHLNPDVAWMADYDADPLVYHGNARATTVYNFKLGIQALQQQWHSMTLPIYILHATGDMIAEYKAVQRFAAAVPVEVTLHTVDGGYHDLLSTGPQQQQYVSSIAAWISNKCTTTGLSVKPATAAAEGHAAGHAGKIPSC